MGNKSWQRILIWAFLSAALTACAIAVPVHEGEPPEVLGNWGFRIGEFAGSAPVIATPSNTIKSSGDEQPIEGLRLGFGFLDRFQLNTDLFAGAANGGTSIALKYQWTGQNYFKAEAGNKVQTSVLRFWNGSAANVELDDQFQFKYGDLDGSGEDFSHLFGYRPVSWFGVYGGPKLIVGNVSAKYKNSDNGPVVQTDHRNIWGGGALGGIFLSPHGEHFGFDLDLEAEVMNLPATYTSARAWYSTFFMTMAFPFHSADDRLAII